MANSNGRHTHARRSREEPRDGWVGNFSCPGLLFLIDLQALFIGPVCGVVTLDVAALLATLVCFLARRDRLPLLFSVSSVNISDSSPACAKTTRKAFSRPPRRNLAVLYRICVARRSVFSREHALNKNRVFAVLRHRPRANAVY